MSVNQDGRRWLNICGLVGLGLAVVGGIRAAIEPVATPPAATAAPRQPAALDRLEGFAAVMERVPGVTGTSVSGWGRTLTIETGIILPGEAREVGDAACQAVAGYGPELRRDGWSVIVKGGSGVALYRCFI